MKRTFAVVLVLIMAVSLCACGETAPAAGKPKAENNDGIIAGTEAAKPHPETLTSHEVKLTAENWAEYFEIAELPLADASGKPECVQFVFRIKEEYKDIVDCGRDFLIHIDYSLTCRGDSSFEYDSAANMLTYTEMHLYPKSGFRGKASFEIANSSIRAETEQDYSRFSAPERCVMESAAVNEDNTIRKYELTVDKISGSLYLFD